MVCRQPLHELRRGIWIRPVQVLRCGTYTGKFDGRGALTGNGRATKEQMQRAVMAQCRLEAMPEPPDVADAIGIALTGGRRLQGVLP